MQISRSWSSGTLYVIGADGARVRSQQRTLCAAAAMTLVPLLSAGAALAAEIGGSDGNSAVALEEIIVTAQRKQENLSDVPLSVSVLSGESLQTLGMSGMDVRQLAFVVPSLQIESSNGRTAPRFYIRGYGNADFTTFASQPVGLYYDEIVQEIPALKGFPIFDQANVEVLRGPQGTLFGRNSPAGVLKLESAKPVLGETSGSVSLAAGTYRSAVLQGVLNLPAGDTTAVRFSAQGQYRDDWVHAPITDEHLGGYEDWAAHPASA